MLVNFSTGILAVGLANTSTDANINVDANTSTELNVNSTFDTASLGFSNVLGIYVLPVISFSGLLLNILSCVVFSSGEFKKLSSSVYIVAILMSDSGILVCLLCAWLSSIGYGITHFKGVCQGFVFFTYQFSFLSAWFLVCLTVEVYVITCHPLTSRNLCTRMTAIVITSTVVVFSIFIYTLTLFLPSNKNSGPKKQAVCGPNISLLWLVKIFSHVDSALSLFLPFLTITSLLILTGIQMMKSPRSQRISTDRSTHVSLQSSEDLLSSSSRSPSVSVSFFQINGAREHRRRSASRGAMWRVIKTLMTLSAFYIVMNAPSHLIRVCYMFRMTAPRESTGYVLYGVLHLIFMYLTYIYYSSKFFIFLVVSSNFSKGLKELKLSCTGL